MGARPTSSQDTGGPAPADQDGFFFDAEECLAAFQHFDKVLLIPPCPAPLACF